MPDELWQWKELKAKFLRDLMPAEQFFFIKKAKECVSQKGYRVGEDLFHYCYFLTMKERMRSIHPHGGEGFMRFLFVEATRDIDKEIKHYEERLEAKKRPMADVMGYKLLEYLSG